MKVFVLDTEKRPLAPCSPRRARLLLDKGKAAVYYRYPFTIILKRKVSDIITPPLQLKVDPGSKTTGIAMYFYGMGTTSVRAWGKYRLLFTLTSDNLRVILQIAL